MFYKIKLLYCIWMLNDITNCMHETKPLANLPHQQNNNVKYCRLGSTSTLIKTNNYYFTKHWIHFEIIIVLWFASDYHDVVIWKHTSFFKMLSMHDVHLTWFFHFILVMQFDKSCPSFISISFFAHESNVKKCFPESIFTHLLHYFISVLQIE
jgi:hypothetical protein